MSSLSSSQSSLPSTPTPPPVPATRPTSSPSSSFYLPTSLALTASGFLKRFYTDPPTSKPAAAASSSHQDSNGGAFTPPRRHASPFQPPPLYPLILKGLDDRASSSSSSGGGTQLLSRAVAEEIRTLIPPRLQLLDEWNLAYSLERDGVSLATLYEKCDRLRASRRQAAFVVVVKDGSGGLFGAYLTDAPHPSPHYYGTGECFLWRASILSSNPLLSSLPPPPSSDTTNLVRSTTISTKPTTNRNNNNNNNNTLSLPPQPPPPSSSTSKSGTSTPEERIRFKAFPYSGVNDYMIFCEQKYLSVGGGDGHYGLWLDDVFEKGISSTCPTFGNEPLSDEGEKFDILGVEVWCVGS